MYGVPPPPAQNPQVFAQNYTGYSPNIPIVMQPPCNGYSGCRSCAGGMRVSPPRVGGWAYNWSGYNCSVPNIPFLGY